MILNLLRIRKEFGMKTALTRVASSQSIAPSDNGRAQDGERQKKKTRSWQDASKSTLQFFHRTETLRREKS